MFQSFPDDEVYEESENLHVLPCISPHFAIKELLLRVNLIKMLLKFNHRIEVNELLKKMKRYLTKLRENPKEVIKQSRNTVAEPQLKKIFGAHCSTVLNGSIKPS